ncbi:class I SAM-dependent methyltransferase [Pacificoceanicola onchidii]|uniref:class I SAM-dependent methyltransferase n=1 Tax=Pacificoceanicola onchidii TaxID=2562685 RepID=UPI0010A41FD8|nr:class I SAM-dependent methyltransferase [Pacificoceanicola onchidii]
MSDSVTIDVYDMRAGEYAEVTASDAPDATLSAFMARLPDKARVLDLGCGPGASAGFMAQAGHDVEAWDASSGMVRLAQEKPGVQARQASFDDLAQVDPQSFDAVWANFSLLHAPRKAMPRHISEIARILKPGGLFHIAVKSGSGEKRDKIGRLYSFYTQDDITGLLLDAGLTPGEYQTGRDRGLDGSLSDWISVTAHA